MSQEWISVDEALPPMGEYVVAKRIGNNWLDSSDQENVNCVVVKMVPAVAHDPNNRRPFSWDTFGPLKLFGQDISHWAPLPSTTS